MRDHQTNRRAGVPISQQIKEYILEEISSGRWVAGDKVPSEAQLSERFSASRMTVNRAVRELTVEGRLHRIQGLGTFVSDFKPLAPLIEIRSIAEEIALRGGVHSCTPIHVGEGPVTTQEAEWLRLPPRSRVYRLKAVHKHDDVPIQFENRIVNPAFCPNFLDLDFTKATASDYLLKNVNFTEVEHRVDAVRPTPEVSKLLEINENDPCLRLVRRTWSEGRLITYVQLIHPGDSFCLVGRFQGRGMAKVVA